MDFYPNIFTVSFFGHAQYDNFKMVEVKLKKEIKKILHEHDAVVFLIERWGSFNISAAYWVRYLKEKYRDSFIQLLLKIPDAPLVPKDSRKLYKATENARTHYKTKAEIGYCELLNNNDKTKMLLDHQYLVDNSDYIICCLQKDKGITYKTIQYAKKQKKKIKNIGTNAKNDPIKLMK